MVTKHKTFVVFLVLIIFLSLNLSFVLAIDWNNFKVFNGATGPYASNGPGCRQPGESGMNMMQPGQNCLNGKADDLGAVWVDMDTNYIAWKVMGPFNSSAGFCNASGDFNNTLMVEFDSDNNEGTGCPGGCYNGADYKVVLNSTGAFFKYFNLSSTSADHMDTNISIYVERDNSSCAQGILKFAVNRSAIRNLTGMRFQINTARFNPTFQLFDSLGGYGEDKIMMNGQQDTMFMGMHPCNNISVQAYCNTSVSNSQGNFSCKWENFSSKCMANFNVIGGAGSGTTCSEFCGGCNGTANCSMGAKGKCMVVKAPSNMPPNSNKWTNVTGDFTCVEDMTKFMMNGGSSGESCSNNCKYCYDRYTCGNSSYPNPMGSGSGCKWVTDPVFGKSWCDLYTYDATKLFCGNGVGGTNGSIEKCFNSTACTGAGGNWSSQFNNCYNSSKELCFDGMDNNGNGLIDCSDSDCTKENFCGGDINVLTGGYGTFDPVLAMKQEMFDGMDMSPPARLFSKNPNMGLPKPIAIREFSIKDMGNSIGMGIGVIGLENKSMVPVGLVNISFLCGGAGGSKYYYFVDSDANLSTGCTVNISGNNYTGFEYRFEYELRNNGSDSALEVRRGYRCVNSNFSLYGVKLAGAPQMDNFGGKSIACASDVAIVAVDKTDLGNPKGNLRFIVATSDNMTNYTNYLAANDTLLGSNNGGIYYTSGSVDFKPTDCSENPVACGTAYSLIGKGRFMPFEDCFLNTGDEDLDGLTNCNDSDCSMAPWCSGLYNFSADKTAPTITSSKVDTFNDFAFLHWVTNKPTNATIRIFNACSNETPRSIFYDLGDPTCSGTCTFDDYRPWHDFGIKNGTTDSTGNITSIVLSTTYFYKLTVCDQGSNCATSGCLNFTTQSGQQMVRYQMDFRPNNATNSMINTTTIKLWNGTAYENVSLNTALNKSNYLNDAKLLFNNSDKNWSIELDGVDLAQAVNLNLSSAFNVTNSSGTIYVGMNNQVWQEVVQNLGTDSVTLQIPGNGTRLIKCNENNLSDCSDVTSQATLNETLNGSVKWEIPSSLGFSTYYVSSQGGSGSYNLNFTNITAASRTVNISTNITLIMNVSNPDNESRIYNVSVVATGSAVGFVNGSSMIQIGLGNLTNLNSTYLNLTVTDSVAESISFKVVATLYNDSTITLNSSDDTANLTVTFLDNIFPNITLVSPVNNTKTNDSATFSCNITDATQVSNLTLYVYYPNGTTFNSSTTSLTGTTNSTSWTMSLPNANDGDYKWNCLGSDSYGNSNWSLIGAGVLGNYTIKLDSIRPYVRVLSPINDSNLSSRFITINLTANDISAFNYTYIVIYNSTGDSVNTSASSGTGVMYNSSIGKYNMTLSVPADGIFSVYAIANDSANNLNVSYVTVRVDTTAPLISVSSPLNGSVYYTNYSVPVYFTSSDLTPVFRKWYSNNSWDNVTFTTPNFLTYNASGMYNLTIYSNDSLNHINSTTVYFTVLDLPTNATVANTSTILVNESITNIIVPFNATLENVTVNSSFSSQEIYLNLSQLLSSGNVTTGNTFNLVRGGSSYNYTVQISNNTVITGNSSWDGDLRFPFVNTTIPAFIAPSSNGTVLLVVEVGSPSLELNFSSPVKIVLGGMAGMRGAWVRNGITFNSMSQCSNVSNPTATIDPVTTRLCYGDSGSDLVIWTYHFTTFAAYNVTISSTDTVDTGGSGSSGGEPVYWTSTYVLSSSEFKNGFTRDFRLREAAKVKVDTEIHTIGVVGLSLDSAIINVSSSKAQQAVFSIGDEKKFDIDSDGYYEIYVKLNTISSKDNTKKANLTIKSIYEKIADAVIPQNKTDEVVPQVNQTIPEPTTKESNSKKTLLNTILIILLIVIIIAVIWILKKTSRRNNNNRYVVFRK